MTLRRVTQRANQSKVNRVRAPVAPVRSCACAPVRVRVRDQGEVEGCAGDEREDDDLFQSLQAWKGDAADWAHQCEYKVHGRARSPAAAGPATTCWSLCMWSWTRPL